MDRWDGEGIERGEEPPTFTTAQQEWIDRLITSKLEASKDPPEESGASGSAVSGESPSHSATAPSSASASGTHPGNVTGKLTFIGCMGPPNQLGG